MQFGCERITSILFWQINCVDICLFQSFQKWNFVLAGYHKRKFNDSVDIPNNSERKIDLIL